MKLKSIWVALLLAALIHHTAQSEDALRADLSETLAAPTAADRVSLKSLRNYQARHERSIARFHKKEGASEAVEAAELRAELLEALNIVTESSNLKRDRSALMQRFLKSNSETLDAVRAHVPSDVDSISLNAISTNEKK